MRTNAGRATRLVVLLVASSAGCKDARDLSKEQIESAVAAKAGLTEIKLHDLGGHRYEGDGRDNAGSEFDVAVEVERRWVHWTIDERPRIIPRDDMPRVLARHAGLTVESLDERAPNAYEGTAVNRDGAKFTISLDATVPERVKVEAVGPDGKVRTVEAVIGNRAYRTGQFTP